MKNNDYAQNVVNEIFTSVTSKYDIMNNIMSLGLHRLWKRKFISQLPILDSDAIIMDLACGTGDIATALAKHKVIACDINREMIIEGMRKAANIGIIRNISWVQCSGESLPFKDNYFDVCTIVFGMRNINNRALAMQEIFRVIKPGGKFMCMEFSHIEREALRAAYSTYSKAIPIIGELITGNKEAYEYLVDSIGKFPTANEFASAMQSCGFSSVSFERLLFGIVAIHQGFKC